MSWQVMEMRSSKTFMVVGVVGLLTDAILLQAASERKPCKPCLIW